MKISGDDVGISAAVADEKMIASDEALSDGVQASVVNEIVIVSDVAVPDEPTTTESSMESETAPVSVEELQHLAGDSDIKACSCELYLHFIHFVNLNMNANLRDLEEYQTI